MQCISIISCNYIVGKRPGCNGDFICIDDRADNIDTAIIKGMQGILVGGDISGTASWWARDIFDVPQAIDMLKQRTKRSFAL